MMVFVAIVALNVGAVRTALATETPTNGLLAAGGMPMASVLIVGILAGYRRPARHPFLLGFLLFGAMALALCVFLAIRFPDETLGAYLDFFLRPVWKATGLNAPASFLLIAYAIAVTVLTLPQLAIAVLGGLASRSYITVRR
jgi:hypothetical protein